MLCFVLFIFFFLEGGGRGDLSLTASQTMVWKLNSVWSHWAQGWDTEFESFGYFTIDFLGNHY